MKELLQTKAMSIRGTEVKIRSLRKQIKLLEEEIKIDEEFGPVEGLRKELFSAQESLRTQEAIWSALFADYWRT
jgi:hypothetical protein